jgi:alpha-ketoglutarate-dependent taurine dioxygenase
MASARSAQLVRTHYAHQHEAGDLVIIDDRASLHKAGTDYGHSQHRRLYRMLVRGDRPY